MKAFFLLNKCVQIFYFLNQFQHHIVLPQGLWWQFKYSRRLQDTLVIVSGCSLATWHVSCVLTKIWQRRKVQLLCQFLQLLNLVTRIRRKPVAKHLEDLRRHDKSVHCYSYLWNYLKEFIPVSRTAYKTGKFSSYVLVTVWRIACWEVFLQRLLPNRLVKKFTALSS